MTLKKKLLVSSIGASLALGTGAALADPENDYYYGLIPYVVKDANRTTVVTVIGDGEQPQTQGVSLHLQYWTKSTTDANTAACQPSSVTMAMTEADIVTFDTAGLLGAGALFGDTTNNAPLGASISYAAPRHGYLFINALDYGGEINALYWLEVDIANGGAHGDRGMPTYNVNLDNDYDAEQVLEDGFGNSQPVAFWPTAVASTVFTVTPLGDDMETNENHSVVMQVRNKNNVQGAYDRNENGIDGTVPQTVRCVGRLTPAQLMPGVVINAAWAAQGGWGELVNLGDGNATSGETTDLDAVVYQVDSSNAAGTGKFMQNAVRIVTDVD